ncbi:MAG: META domain-containing protein [Bacteroidales bacterium]
MKKLLYLLLLVLVVGACKSKKETIIVTPDDVAEIISDMSVDKLNNVWKLVSMEGNLVSPANFSSDVPSIMIDSKSNSFDGVDGCNMLRGGVVVKENSVKFNPSMTTRKMCKKSDFSNKFSQLLTSGDLSYKIVDNSLFLYSGDKEVLKFESE